MKTRSSLDVGLMTRLRWLRNEPNRIGTCVEILLALYFACCIGYSIYALELAALPCQILFLFGLGIVG